uniref:Uncharacterized protein n=1 Tax=Arundo donax TaxID=35708 RepID=A0A0A8Z515_ARUDO
MPMCYAMWKRSLCCYDSKYMFTITQNCNTHARVQSNFASSCIPFVLDGWGPLSIPMVWRERLHSA